MAKIVKDFILFSRQLLILMLTLSILSCGGGGAGSDNNNNNDNSEKDVFAQALGDTSVSVAHSGDANWVVTSNHFDNSRSTEGENVALQSGVIENGQTSCIETIFIEDKEIEFSWKISSDGGDALRLYINNEFNVEIKGQSDWSLVQKSIILGNNTNILVKWCYEKDDANSSYDDAAWLDSLTTISKNKIPNLIPTITSNSQTDQSIELTWDNDERANYYFVSRSNSASGNYATIQTLSTNLFSDSNLEGNTTYYYKIKACYSNNLISCSNDSAVKELKTAMSNPKNVIASINSDTAININWEVVAGAVNYKLYRSENELSYEFVNDIGVMNYTDSGLIENNLYSYKIIACLALSDSTTCGTGSITNTIKLSLETPSVITHLILDVQDHQSIQLSWSNVENANQYKVFTSANGVNYDEGVLVNTITHQVTSLSSNTTYYFKVQSCVTSAICSADSEVVQSKTKLNHPINVDFIDITDSNLKVTWSNSNTDASATSYYALYRKDISNTNYKLIYNGTNLYFTDVNLTSNALYYYKVKACNDSIQSDCSISFSSVASIRTKLIAPNFELDLELITSQESLVNISITPVNGALFYEIYSGLSANGTFTKIISTKKYTYTHTLDGSVKYNRNYYYKIKACIGYQGINCSNLTQEKKVRTPIVPPKNPPVLQITSAGINVIWTDDNYEAASHFQLYRASKNYGLYTTYTKIYSGIEMNYLDTSVGAQSAYYYKVKACNSADDTDCSNSFSQEAKIFFGTLDTMLELQYFSTKQIEVKFATLSSSSAEILYYSIEKSLSATSDFSEIYRSNTHYYLDTAVDYNTNYYYRVKVCLSATNGDNSTCGQPSSVTHITSGWAQSSNLEFSNITESSMHITWENEPNNANYYVLYKSVANSAYSIIYRGTNSSYDDTNLTAYTVYKYKIKACSDSTALNCSPESEVYNSITSITSDIPFTLTTDQNKNIKLQITRRVGVVYYHIHKSTHANSNFTELRVEYINNIATELEYIDTSNKNSNTAYYYKIKGCRTTTSDCGEFSTVQNITTVLFPPQQISVSVNSSESISVNWTDLNDVAASHFIVEQSSTIVGGYTQIYNNTANSYTVSGLQANTRYYFKVKACSSSGVSNCSLTSNAVYGLTGLTQASNPTLLLTTEGQIDISYNAIDGGKYYIIEKSVADNTNFQEIANTEELIFYDTDSLIDSTTYFYRIKACRDKDKISCGAYSSEVDILYNPQAPENLTLTYEAENSVSINWDANAVYSEYRLFSSNSLQGSYSQIYQGINSNYTHSDLTKDTRYFYKVKGCTSLNDTNSCLTFSSAKVFYTQLAKYYFSLEIGESSANIQYYIDSPNFDAGRVAPNFDVYRSTTQDCNIANHTLCADSTMTNISINPNQRTYAGNIVDSFITRNLLLEQPIYLTFKNDHNQLQTVKTLDILDSFDPFPEVSAYILFKNEIYMIGGADDHYYTSKIYKGVWKTSDGENWIKVTDNVPFSSRIDFGIAVLGDDLYISGGYESIGGTSLYSDVWKTSDGLNWTEVTQTDSFGELASHKMFAKDGKLFIIGGYTTTVTNSYSHKVWSSDDGGQNWTHINSNSPNEFDINIFDVINFKGDLYLMGNTQVYEPTKIFKSTDDGVNWNEINPTGDSLSSNIYLHHLIEHNEEIYLVSPYAQSVHKSSDGEAWTLVKNPILNEKRHGGTLIKKNDQFYLLGSSISMNNWYYESERVYQSTDFINWETIGFYNRDFLKNAHYDIALINDSFIMTSATDKIWLSKDGANWYSVDHSYSNFAQDYEHQTVEFNNRLFIFGKDSIWKSDDEQGKTWTKLATYPDYIRGYSNRQGFQVIEFKSKLYLYGGIGTYSSNSLVDLNNVWESSNGEDWIKVADIASTSNIVEGQFVVFNDKLYIIAGATKSSVNGNWMPLLGRASNEIWESSDGKNWSKLTLSSVFDAVKGHSVVVLNNKVYIIAGATGENLNGLSSTTTITNVIWESSDMLNWQKVNTVGYTFSKRVSHKTIVKNGSIYLFGGTSNLDSDSSELIKIFDYEASDIWKSEDAINWRKVIPIDSTSFNY